jgi:signal transduction histidine kinase
VFGRQLEAELQAREAQVWVQDGLPPVVGHPATVHQVVVNLLANAIKFVAPGVKPEVRIWGESRGEWIRLWVEDNGIGIAPEYHERIFGLFERLCTGTAPIPAPVLASPLCAREWHGWVGGWA